MPQSDSAWWISEWHTPHAAMSMSTSRGPTSRRSIVMGVIGALDSSAPYARACMNASGSVGVEFKHRGRGVGLPGAQVARAEVRLVGGVGQPLGLQ